jgi:hypothetical protein
MQYDFDRCSGLYNGLSCNRCCSAAFQNAVANDAAPRHEIEKKYTQCMQACDCSAMSPQPDYANRMIAQISQDRFIPTAR